MNSIAAYIMESRFREFFREAWQRHLGPHIPAIFGAAYAPFFIGVLVVLKWMPTRAPLSVDEPGEAATAASLSTAFGL